MFSRIAELYRDALGVAPESVNRLLAPARHFIETSQYRLVYGLMREWFELRPVEAEKLVSRLASVTSPRLYEYCSLVSLLGGLERRGWTSVEAKRRESMRERVRFIRTVRPRHFSTPSSSGGRKTTEGTRRS